MMKCSAYSQPIYGLLCSTFLLLLAGCGPTVVTLSGNITVNGQPVEKGVIDFASLENSAGSSTAEIAGGRYRVKVSPGKKHVSISAPVVTDRRPEHNGPGALMVEITKESLPDKYNAKTELTFDVTLATKEKDFELKVP